MGKEDMKNQIKAMSHTDGLESLIPTQEPVRTEKKAANKGGKNDNDNVSITCSRGLRTRLKKAAVELDIPMQQIIEETLDKALNKKGY